ncbi:SDR family oxidoreductase [uncultured Rhodoblastus sp.]|uniref:SDR family oxidoreductase n=1 Tax=uncultured Rhodoblastus sp. TaxID=543037 RepID=UPI0025D17085|nr:SDR family oxidoreductase [uncultured Rhodoblastus sp.]
MNLVIIGLGYSASYFAAHHASAFQRVTGTQRAPRHQRLGRVELLPFDGAAPSREPRLLGALAEADALLVSAGPDAQGDPALRLLAKEIAAAPRLKRIVYLSTIGVYGDHGGAWIDETAQTDPANGRSRLRLAAEAGWSALAQGTAREIYILRLSGIYGPSRNMLVKLREGTAKRLVKPGQVFNRIHVEDISRAIEACLTGQAPGGVYNVTDDEPAPPQDVVLFAALKSGMAPPPEQDFDAAQLTPMARTFYGENKRVSNRRMKENLRFDLAFPTYREGIAALWAHGEGRKD